MATSASSSVSGKKPTFLNIDGTPSDAVYASDSVGGVPPMVWADSLSPDEQKSIHTIVVDHRTWHRFLDSSQMPLVRTLPRLKEILLVVAEVKELVENEHLQFVELQPDRIVWDGQGIHLDLLDEEQYDSWAEMLVEYEIDGYESWEQLEASMEVAFGICAEEDNQLYEWLQEDPEMVVPQVRVVGVKKVDP